MLTWRGLRNAWIVLTIVWLPVVGIIGYSIVANELDLSPFPRNYILDLENGTFARHQKYFAQTPVNEDLSLDERLRQNTAIRLTLDDGSIVIATSENSSRVRVPDPDSIQIRKLSLPGLFVKADYRVFTPQDYPAVQERAEQAYQQYIYFHPPASSAKRWLLFLSFLLALLLSLPTLLTAVVGLLVFLPAHVFQRHAKRNRKS